MKKQGLTVTEVLVGLTGIVILGIILFPILARHQSDGPPGPGARCRSNLKVIGLSVSQYIQDYNEKFPLVRGSKRSGPNYNPPYGWADALQPYLKSTQLFQCPAQSGTPNAVGTPATVSALAPQFTDYWFNAWLSGAPVAGALSAARTFLAGDGNDGTEICDARYALSNLPQSWRQDNNSPAFRHNGSAIYVFVDGHAKWLQPEKVTSDPVGKSSYSFVPGPDEPLPKTRRKEVP